MGDFEIKADKKIKTCTPNSTSKVLAEAVDLHNVGISCGPAIPSMGTHGKEILTVSVQVVPCINENANC